MCDNRGGGNSLWTLESPVFAHQADLSEEELIRRASSAGVDIKTFQTCFQGEAAEEIRQAIQEGARLGIRGTPTFLVGRLAEGGKKVHIVKKIARWQNYEAFRSAAEQVVNLKAQAAM